MQKKRLSSTINRLSTNPVTLKTKISCESETRIDKEEVPTRPKKPEMKSNPQVCYINKFNVQFPVSLVSPKIFILFMCLLSENVERAFFVFFAIDK
jgi:hypothetical protein